jgi:hypothetical protein
MPADRAHGRSAGVRFGGHPVWSADGEISLGIVLNSVGLDVKESDGIPVAKIDHRMSPVPVDAAREVLGCGNRQTVDPQLDLKEIGADGEIRHNILATAVSE